jgi:hypothetical protein
MAGVKTPPQGVAMKQKAESCCMVDARAEVCSEDSILKLEGRPGVASGYFSAVAAGLFVLSKSYPGRSPISANLFGMFFFKTPTKSSS